MLVNLLYVNRLIAKKLRIVNIQSWVNNTFEKYNKITLPLYIYIILKSVIYNYSSRQLLIDVTFIRHLNVQKQYPALIVVRKY